MDPVATSAGPLWRAPLKCVSGVKSPWRVHPPPYNVQWGEPSQTPHKYTQTVLHYVYMLLVSNQTISHSLFGGSLLLIMDLLSSNGMSGCMETLHL